MKKMYYLCIVKLKERDTTMAKSSILEKAEFYADSIIKDPKNGIGLIHKKQLIDAYLTGAAQQKAEIADNIIKRLKGE